MSILSVELWSVKQQENIYMQLHTHTNMFLYAFANMLVNILKIISKIN